MNTININKTFINLIENTNNLETIEVLLKQTIINDNDIDKTLDLIIKQPQLVSKLKVTLEEIFYQKFTEQLVFYFKEVCEIQSNFISIANKKSNSAFLTHQDFYNENYFLVKELNQENENKLQQRLKKIGMQINNNKVNQLFNHLTK